MPQDPLRPPELITIVLKAAVFGLLKSCDLACRELFKGHVNEVVIIHQTSWIFLLIFT